MSMTLKTLSPDFGSTSASGIKPTETHSSQQTAHVADVFLPFVAADSRVFSDRLVDHSDTGAFVTLLSQKLDFHFNTTFHSICPNKQPPIFGIQTCTHAHVCSSETPHVYVFIPGDFISGDMYEDLVDMKILKKFMENQLEEYNLTPGVVPMSLVLFQDAIEHSTPEDTCT